MHKSNPLRDICNCVQLVKTIIRIMDCLVFYEISLRFGALSISIFENKNYNNLRLNKANKIVFKFTVTFKRKFSYVPWRYRCPPPKKIPAFVNRKHVMALTKLLFFSSRKVKAR